MFMIFYYVFIYCEFLKKINTSKTLLNTVVLNAYFARKWCIFDAYYDYFSAYYCLLR